MPLEVGCHVVTLETVQHTGPPYSFRSCTLFHDVDPFHCQQNEETCVEGETSSHLTGPKIWVFPEFSSGKNSSLSGF
jgi:hypothetical protein